MKETVMQFGEGGFLRGFVDYFFKKLNDAGVYEGKVVVIQPIDKGMVNMLNDQNCEYNLYLRGLQNGEEVIEHTHVDVISRGINPYEDFDAYMALAENPDLRVIVSNTTEAGIEYLGTEKLDDKPAKSYPAKLTQFLYKRFQTGLKGFILLPCELIDHNADTLKECVLKYADLWELGDEFKNWLLSENDFCNTLVDRIVTGYPRAEAADICKELGYTDNLIDTAEIFHLWVIQGHHEDELPFNKAGYNIVWTDDVAPYKKRKVRILNGAHTSFVLASYLCGNDIVRQSMQDDDIRNFMLKTIYDEVIPTLSLPEEELKQFAGEVVNRFNNPYVDHALLAISLNSVSKWRARCMPSLLGYVEKTGKLPAHLTFSIAALMAFYTGTEIRDKALIGHRDGQEYNIMDDKAVLEFFAANCEKDTKTFVTSFLGNEDFFGQDLNKVPGLTDAVVAYLDDIKANGMRAALCKIS